MLRPRKINSQGIVFTLTQTYREILKSALVSVSLITCKTFFGMLIYVCVCVCAFVSTPLMFYHLIGK